MSTQKCIPLPTYKVTHENGKSEMVYTLMMANARARAVKGLVGRFDKASGRWVLCNKQPVKIFSNKD